jgi:hypothetical protein
VVTLRGLYGNSRAWTEGCGPVNRNFQTRQPKRYATNAAASSYSPASVRTVAFGAANELAPKTPLRATSSKSQPPHLVLDFHNYYHIQNLSFDHLLSGVIAD